MEISLVFSFHQNMSDQDFEWEDYNVSTKEILYPPSYIYRLHCEDVYVVAVIYDSDAWYKHIIQRFVELWSEVNPRELKNPITKQSILSRLKYAMTLNRGQLRDNKLEKLIDEALGSLPMVDDAKIDRLAQEIRLCKEGCNIQVKIMCTSSENSMLQCSKTSCLGILKDILGIIVEEICEYYPTKAIYIFVPEAILSSYHKDWCNLNKEDIKDLVPQAQADATWDWLLKNGCNYCDDIEHDNPGFEREYIDCDSTHNNVCPYFRYEHKPTIVPE